LRPSRSRSWIKRRRNPETGRREIETESAATLFARLVDAVQVEFDLGYDKAMRFIRESSNAGGFPNREEEPELVEELRQVAAKSTDR
jgi:hypothetical protein